MKMTTLRERDPVEAQVPTVEMPRGGHLLEIMPNNEVLLNGSYLEGVIADSTRQEGSRWSEPVVLVTLKLVAKNVIWSNRVPVK